MSVTDELMNLDPNLVPALYKNHEWFDQTDEPKISFPSGVECSVGEMLSALVAILRPQHILETGTRLGIATRYMACAIDRWEIPGKITTIERCGYCYPRATKKLKEQFPSIEIGCVFGESLAYTPPAGTMYDMLFLDTEPCYRFQELFQFWSFLRDGGIAIIHDLAGLPDKGFPDFPLELRRKFETRELQALTFLTDTGLSIFQKAANLWKNKENEKPSA